MVRSFMLPGLTGYDFLCDQSLYLDLHVSTRASTHQQNAEDVERSSSVKHQDPALALTSFEIKPYQDKTQLLDINYLQELSFHLF